MGAQNRRGRAARRAGIKFLYRLLDPRPLSAEEMAEGYDCFDTADFQTGFRAFLDKTKPVFEGR